MQEKYIWHEKPIEMGFKERFTLKQYIFITFGTSNKNLCLNQKKKNHNILTGNVTECTI